MKQAERPGLHRWSRHEYGRLIDHGFLDEDDPIELLDGLLLVKEPQHSRHRTAVLLVAKALERRSAKAGSSRRRARSSSMTAPSLSQTSASFRAYRATTSTRIRRGRRWSSRSRIRAYAWLEDGKPRDWKSVV